MYADNMTDSMHAAITETERRRTIQDKYNKEHGNHTTDDQERYQEISLRYQMITKKKVRDMKRTWNLCPRRTKRSDRDG